MAKNNGNGKGKFTAPFYMSFLSALGQLAEMKLQGRVLSVLLYLIANMAYENFLTINQSEIGARLKMHRAHVSRAIATLLRLGIIETGFNKMGVKCYRLCPEFGWRGDVENIFKSTAIFKSISDKQAVANMEY